MEETMWEEDVPESHRLEKSQVARNLIAMEQFNVVLYLSHLGLYLLNYN